MLTRLSKLLRRLSAGGKAFFARCDAPPRHWSAQVVVFGFKSLEAAPH